MRPAPVQSSSTDELTTNTVYLPEYNKITRFIDDENNETGEFKGTVLIFRLMEI
jgi:hypothetical protein